jgi:hypothetical protein
LGLGDVLDGRAVLEVVPVLAHGAVGPTISKKRDAAAMSKNTLPKGDPSVECLKVTEQI